MSIEKQSKDYVAIIISYIGAQLKSKFDDFNISVERINRYFLNEWVIEIDFMDVNFMNSIIAIHLNIHDDMVYFSDIAFSLYDPEGIPNMVKYLHQRIEQNVKQRKALHKHESHV